MPAVALLVEHGVTRVSVGVQSFRPESLAALDRRHSAAQDVIVRVLGPSLPVEGALADPTLELYDENGVLLRSNDNWRNDQPAEIEATMLQPTDHSEAAIVATLMPAPYTAIVRGANETTGVALVEIYALN